MKIIRRETTNGHKPACLKDHRVGALAEGKYGLLSPPPRLRIPIPRDSRIASAPGNLNSVEAEQLVFLGWRWHYFEHDVVKFSVTSIEG